MHERYLREVGMNTRDVHILTQKNEQKWDNFVRRFEGATFFHRIGWKNVVEKTYHHKAYYLFTEDDAGEITGVLPLFFIKSLIFGQKLVSLPFAPYGGVCAADESAAASLVAEAITRSESLGKKYIELRSFNERPYPGFSCMRGYSTFIMDVHQDEKELWQNIGKKNRNMIRKGVKSGLIYRWREERSALSEFYEVYTENISAMGTPAHGFDFFKAVYDQFPGDIAIAEVTLRNEPIASLLLLYFKERMISGWGGSLPDTLAYAPNNFLYWNSLLAARQKGYTFFDFGRSLEGTGNYHFKRHWGATEHPLTYWYYPGDRDIRPPQGQYEFFARVWKHVPVSINRRIGPLIRRSVL